MINPWIEVVDLDNPIVEYIRNRRNNKIGVLVSGIIATDDGEKVVVGWSLCSKYDTFNKLKGVEIASGRAYANGKFAHQINDGIVEVGYNTIHISIDDLVPMVAQLALVDFVARVRRYYKNTEFSEFAEMFDI